MVDGGGEPGGDDTRLQQEPAAALREGSPPPVSSSLEMTDEEAADHLETLAEAEGALGLAAFYAPALRRGAVALRERAK